MEKKKKDIMGVLFIKMAKRKSRIFGNKELQMLEKRISGDKKDPTGLWSSKVKPKVKELVDDWIPRKKELKKSIEVKKHGKK